MDEYAGVRPVYEARVVADHRIDHVIIMIDETVT